MSDSLDLFTTTSKRLPATNGAIDWDEVAEKYFDYILSPYASEMVRGCEQGMGRNLLLNYLHSLSIEDLNQLRILDVGCGPGNLIPHIKGKVNRLVGLDLSKTSLSIAAQKAFEFKLEFESIHEDMLNVDDENEFDLIISSNSILPNSRQDVVSIFAKLANLLAENGKLIAILPSFDTTLYLQALRANCPTNSDEVPLMDADNLAYADDGRHLQCYHTPSSILYETRIAGLKLIGSLQKVYYPWDLCRRFGYGYFPQAGEEIWDWFMIAEKTKS